MGAFNHMNGEQQGGTYGPASTAGGGWGGQQQLHTVDPAPASLAIGTELKAGEKVRGTFCGPKPVYQTLQVA